MDSGFHIHGFRIPFWILDSISWIPDSTDQNYLDSGFRLLAFFFSYASLPWKLNRYSYGVQFGINCTALDLSKLTNFVECTIIAVIVIFGVFLLPGCCINLHEMHLKTLLLKPLSSCWFTIKISTKKAAFRRLIGLKCIEQTVIISPKTDFGI